MSRTIVLSGYSDDCHQVKVDKGRTQESYAPFRVTIKFDGQEVLATMRWKDGWECTLTVPDSAEILSVDTEREDE